MNGKTRLYRQIHPRFVNEGHIGSQAFRPPSGDPRLSVYDGDQITAEEAWRHYTSIVKCESGGVMAVIVDECTHMGLDVVPDPEPYKEHALIDFGKATNRQIRKASQRLRAAAVQRGWLFEAGLDK